MSITPLGLAGVSKYASDFQTILNRSVNIAAVPVRLLQNRDSDALQQKSLLGALQSDVAGLAASLSSLGDLAAHQAISATSSDASLVSIASNGADTPATYTIDSITSIATAAAERTLSGYADSATTPVSSTGAVKLTVGSQDYTFPLTDNSLIGLRDQINGLGAGVTASILTTANGNYLSIAASSTGATTLQLIDDPNGTPVNLLTSTNQGTEAIFKLNGINVTQAGNLSNNIIPGVTFRLLAPSTTPVTLQLATDRSQLSAALGEFVTRYNTLKTAVNAQVGEHAGLLSGNAVVSGLQRTLREIVSYRTGTGSVRSLADLGISFDHSGKASFDPAVFSALDDTSVSAAFQFVGSVSKGLGGFSKALTQYSDPVTGLIRHEQDGLDQVDRHLQKQIETLTARAAAMQNKLVERLTAADSLLAQLEAQQNMLTASLQGLSLVLYGKNDK